MPTALFLSPHLDDAAFSCGGLMAQLRDAGWRTVMATAFTATVLPVTGFALACQLDKGLSADVDYMAARRGEDRVAADILGVTDLRWLDLPEAPHRGYESAPALFGGVRDGDGVWQDLAHIVTALRDELQPDLVLAPQGLGGHVDHLQTIRAVLDAPGPGNLAFYRDTPYAIRNPLAVPDEMLHSLTEYVVNVEAGLDRRIAASCAYESQIGFQFNGAEALDQALRAFASREGQGRPAERFLGAPGCFPASVSHRAAIL